MFQFMIGALIRDNDNFVDSYNFKLYYKKLYSFLTDATLM